MNSTDTLHDLLTRTRDSLDRLPTFDAATLNAHPGGHPNSPAWLLWHTGREIDLQLAHLSGGGQVWETYRERFGLGEIGDSLGYGHSATEAESVQVADQGLLVEYIAAALDAVASHIGEVRDWDEVIDTYDGQPITRQVRLTSLLIDALEHLAQAHYIAGMPSVVS